MVVDSTSRNESVIIERAVDLELEKKIYSITKGASSAYSNYFNLSGVTNLLLNLSDGSFFAEQWVTYNLCVIIC